MKPGTPTSNIKHSTTTNDKGLFVSAPVTEYFVRLSTKISQDIPKNQEEN